MSKDIALVVHIPVATFNQAKALVNLRSRENPSGKYNMDKLIKDSLDSFCFKLVQDSFDKHIMKGGE